MTSQTKAQPALSPSTKIDPRARWQWARDSGIRHRGDGHEFIHGAVGRSAAAAIVKNDV